MVGFSSTFGLNLNGTYTHFLEQTNKANCKRMNKNKNKNNVIQPKLFINNRRRMVKNGILLL